eukprot:scaffold48704_cov41-Phaeocystis_antarctica.AAC.1
MCTLKPPSLAHIASPLLSSATEFRCCCIVRSAIFEFDSPSSPSWSSNRAVLETAANMVSSTKERAIDPLLVPALLSLATPSIC